MIRWRFIRASAIGAALALPGLVCTEAAAPPHAVGGLRQMERLGRGVVAVHQGSGKVFLSWRLLGTDPENIGFNLYRSVGGKPAKLNTEPLSEVTWYQDYDVDSSQPIAYFVRPVLNGQEQASSASFEFAANAPARRVAGTQRVPATLELANSPLYGAYTRPSVSSSISPSRHGICP